MPVDVVDVDERMANDAVLEVIKQIETAHDAVSIARDLTEGVDWFRVFESAKVAFLEAQTQLRALEDASRVGQVEDIDLERYANAWHTVSLALQRHHWFLLLLQQQGLSTAVPLSSNAETLSPPSVQAALIAWAKAQEARLCCLLLDAEAGYKDQQMLDLEEVLPTLTVPALLQAAEQALQAAQQLSPVSSVSQVSSPSPVPQALHNEYAKPFFTTPIAFSRQPSLNSTASTPSERPASFRSVPSSRTGTADCTASFRAHCSMFSTPSTCSWRHIASPSEHARQSVTPPAEESNAYPFNDTLTTMFNHYGDWYGQQPTAQSTEQPRDQPTVAAPEVGDTASQRVFDREGGYMKPQKQADGSLKLSFPSWEEAENFFAAFAEASHQFCVTNLKGQAVFRSAAQVKQLEVNDTPEAIASWRLVPAVACKRYPGFRPEKSERVASSRLAGVG